MANIIRHNHDEGFHCPQNCPGRYLRDGDDTHVFTDTELPAHLYTCPHPEDAQNCVTETSTGALTHAHTCDDCVPDKPQVMPFSHSVATRMETSKHA